ncbi:MAG: type II secretion system F family protein [Alphaproteobacteria bacterium]|nr:type II secretion system F family protein [Alphaproteobacteria bacterium]
MSIAQIVLIGLIVVIIMVSVALFMMNQEAEKKKRIRNVIQGQSSGPMKLEIDSKDDQNKRRDEIARKLKETKDDHKKKTPISMLIAQAGLKISVKQYWIFSVLSMFLFVGLAKMFGHGGVVLLCASVIGLLGFPRFVLKFLAGKRQKKFLLEFPDALEATVRLLKAGMPVSEAILMISREFSGPVGEEMSRVYDQQKIGVPMHEAAQEATKRMPLPEMQMFATGLAIQAQTGSSLSEVLTNLANVIRSRFRLKRKIKALSSEAIASASIIGALPNLVALGLYFVNREYIMVLFTDPFGKILLAGAVIWMCIGILVMKIMINFKV